MIQPEICIVPVIYVAFFEYEYIYLLKLYYYYYHKNLSHL